MNQNDKIKEARKLFGDFSGHLLDQEYNIDLEAMNDDDGVIFAFGRLDRLLDEDGDDIAFDASEAPILCSSFDGKQLYIVGGTDGFEAFDGVIPIKSVEYSTYRDNKFEQYRHEFDSSDLPMLGYDPTSEELFFEDGLYTFTERGIENS